MNEARIWHGGDLDEARRLFPGASEPWIDLSTGINPIPYPMPALPASSFERLPSPGDLADLEAAAAEAYEACDTALVVAAPGTQVLISILPLLRSGSKVAVHGPTYAEHAAAWRNAGHEVAQNPASNGHAGHDVLVVVNPNNPDGRLLGRQELLDRAEILRKRNGWLVVDEAFADFDQSQSLAPLLPENAIVLRSFGKTYGLAGIRLGFAVAHVSIASRLKTALGPWAVSGPAIETGRQALRDRDWRKAAGEARRGDARRLDALLRPIATKEPTGTSLYRLIESARAPDLFAYLGQRGIWVRRFEYNPALLRFGLPGVERAWERLSDAVASFR